MQLFIYNLDFEFLGIVEEINDIEWIREYYRGGNFTLNAKMNLMNVSLLKKDRIIIKDGDFTEPMIIEYRQLEENDDGDEDLMVTGQSLATRILSSRVVLGRQIEKNTADKVLENLLIKQTTGANRQFPALQVDTTIKKGFNTIEHNALYSSLYEAYETICTANQCGYKVILDPVDKKYIFKVYKGEDVSDNILFSIDFDNLKNQIYIDSTDNYKNVGIVAGQGEEEERDLVVVNDELYSGFERREEFFDARDIEQDTKKGVDTDGNEIDIPIKNGAKAVKLLTQRGLEKLAELEPINSFDAELVENNYKYKEDFDLGYLVTVRNKNWGVEFKQRITRIVESYGEYGRNIKINFGNEQATVFDKLKQRIQRG